MRNRLILFAATDLAASGVQAATRGRMAGAELAPMAKVPLATARRTALEARPGRITDQELERRAAAPGCATRSTS